jgi:hypothetical protein
MPAFQPVSRPDAARAQRGGNAMNLSLQTPCADLHALNPLQDRRWVELVGRHPHSSIFHTPAWLDALHRTYGYEPVVYTTNAPSERELTNGLVCCRINSWLTGSRLVSLAFSDHCQPLASGAGELETLIARLLDSFERQNVQYIEMRPLISGASGFEALPGLAKSASFCHHSLDLRPELEALFRGFHKSCVQRKIFRAHREALTYEEGRSETLLKAFYSLLVLTRKRHGLIPQPIAWFRALLHCLQEASTIRVVWKNRTPVASIMTLHHRNRVIYKYGCSDARFNHLGGIPFLFWQTIQEAKRLRAVELDLGRSDYDQLGLIAFKQRLGAVPGPLTYYRYPRPAPGPGRRNSRFVSALCERLPSVVSQIGGSLLYRHVG